MEKTNMQVPNTLGMMGNMMNFLAYLFMGDSFKVICL